GLGPAEVERHDRLDPGIQRGRNRRRVAAPRDRAQQDDPLRVDSRAGAEHVQAAHQVPDHPAHETLAGDLELQPGLVAEVIILTPGPERAWVVLLGTERML